MRQTCIVQQARSPMPCGSSKFVRLETLNNSIIILEGQWHSHMGHLAMVSAIVTNPGSNTTTSPITSENRNHWDSTSCHVCHKELSFSFIFFFIPFISFIHSFIHSIIHFIGVSHYHLSIVYRQKKHHQPLTVASGCFLFWRLGLGAVFAWVTTSSSSFAALSESQSLSHSVTQSKSCFVPIRISCLWRSSVTVESESCVLRLGCQRRTSRRCSWSCSLATVTNCKAPASTRDKQGTSTARHGLGGWSVGHSVSQDQVETLPAKLHPGPDHCWAQNQKDLHLHCLRRRHHYLCLWQLARLAPLRQPHRASRATLIGRLDCYTATSLLMNETLTLVTCDSLDIDIVFSHQTPNAVTTCVVVGHSCVSVSPNARRQRNNYAGCAERWQPAATISLRA